MTDYTELKRLAEACGDLNWRFLTERLTEYGIRDDHGYIAFLPVGHPAKYGACPEREAKARFLGAMTPDVVLALIAENESAHKHWQNESNNVQVLVAEVARLKAENEALRTGLKGDFDLDAWLDWAKESGALRKMVSEISLELRKASSWICREVEAGTQSATHWAIRLREKADRIDAALGKGEQS